jgi:hypothetical protein
MNRGDDMKKALLALFLGIIAAALPSHVIADSGLGVTGAGPAQAFGPAALFARATHAPPLLPPTASVVALPS